jgi:hypothetical protein
MFHEYVNGSIMFNHITNFNEFQTRQFCVGRGFKPLHLGIPLIRRRQGEAAKSREEDAKNEAGGGGGQNLEMPRSNVWPNHAKPAGKIEKQTAI